MSEHQRAIVVTFLVCLTVAAWAQQDAEGSKDHPLIARYPGSFIAEYDQKEFDEYELPVGKSVETKDGWKMTTQHMEGKITLIHYEYPQGRSHLEVYRNYQTALQKAGFQEVFKCVDREGCGAGDLKKLGYWGGWNNHYLLTKLSRGEGDVYAAVNWADGGDNRAVFLGVFEVKPMEGGLITVNAAALGNDISRTGHSAVYGIYFDTGKADVKPESDAALGDIAKLLQQNAALKLHVVGHTDNVGQLASNMDLSHRRADAVVKALTTKYSIAAARLGAQGVGPLAPVASNDSEDGRSKNRRVELVKQ
jgi:OOP family OmpA-OmpF porin